MSQLGLNNKSMDSKLPPRLLKIKIPKIDNSALLPRSSKVLMGRWLNPLIQNVDTFLFRLSQFWNLVGRVSGLNLGNGRFQFEFQAESDLEIGEEVAKETLSSKKVQCPLFQEETRETLINSNKSLMVADVPASDPTVKPDLDSIEVPEKQGTLSSKQLDELQSEVDEGSKMELMGAESGKMEDSILDTIAFEAVMHSRQHLTEAEKAQIHEEFAAKLHKCKETRIVKPPLEAGKPVTQALTPLRGVCTKKMALIGTMSPRKTPRNVKPKEGRTKEQDKGSMKF